MDMYAAIKSRGVVAFINGVAAHLASCSARRAVRNQHREFLPIAGATDRFGAPHIFSTLQRRLQSMGKAKASGDQWLKTNEIIKR